MEQGWVVRVPASSANVGPAFDAVAVALGAYLEVSDVGDEPATENHPAVRAFRGAGGQGRLCVRSQFPGGRGMGYSAAARVAGLLAVSAQRGQTAREARAETLRAATELEGHADNAAAALHGGFVVSADIDGSVEALRFDAPRDLRAVLFIPELRLSTAAMRKALPKSVPLADAVANLGAVGVGVAGLAAGRTDLLARMTVDRLHEPYRAKVFPQLPRLVAAAREAGALGACLSGAGSTVMAFVDSMTGITRVEGAFAAAAADTDLEGRILVVEPRNAGARVVSAA